MLKNRLCAIARVAGFFFPPTWDKMISALAPFLASPSCLIKAKFWDTLCSQQNQGIDGLKCLSNNEYLTGHCLQGQRVVHTVLYLRVSTAQQKPDLQRDDLHSYAARTGLAIITEYTDVAVSGRKEGRPQLQALMHAARMRTFECVLVWKFDRFARSVAHLLQALEEFNHLGIRLISLAGPDRYTEPHGESDVYNYWGDGRVGVRADC